MNKSTTITFCLSQNVPGVYFHGGGGIFWTITTDIFILVVQDYDNTQSPVKVGKCVVCIHSYL